VTLERLWAGWRSKYVSELAGVPNTDCFFCALCTLPEDSVYTSETLVLERTATTLTVMNLYPYGSGHLLVSPTSRTSPSQKRRRSWRRCGARRVR
jgi:ATP adenylyltransferase